MNISVARVFWVLSILVATNAAAKPLRVAFSYWFPLTPLYIAEQEGYWKKRGLDVEVKAFATGQEVNAALKAGEIDVGYDMIGSWFDLAQQDIPIVILGETDWSNGGDKLLIRTGSKLEDLKGSPIVIYQRSSALLLFLRETLRREKLAMSDFKIVEISDDAKMKETFEQKRVNLALSYDPIAQQIAESGATPVASTADFPGVMPEGFAARSELANPEGDIILEKFFAGWFEAVRYLHDPVHRAAIARLASEKTFAATQKVTEEDVQTYEKTTPVHEAAYALKRNDLNSENVQEFITSIQVLWHQEGRASARMPLTEFYHLEPLRAAAAADQAHGGTK